MTTSNEHRTQLLHWQLAIERLARLEDSASAEGWIRLERQSNAVIRSSLRKTIAKLHRDAQRLSDSIGIEDNEQIASRILRIREDYLRTEKVVNFFADAINTRSSEKIGNVLRGLDRIASEGMNRILGPLGYSTPPVLVFKDAGLGAAIMRSGQYLWDRRSINPVAAIKVVGHNLYTATSILHELGHQVSHMTGWKKELGDALQRAIPGDLGAVWRSWSSEVSADAIALVFAGHASIAALRNVVDGGPRRVFQFHTGDPHPIGMLRVLMTCRFARLCLGGGLLHPATDNADETAPWLSLESAWRQKYPLRGASDSVQRIIAGSDPLLPTIAKVVLQQRYESLGGRSLTSIINPKAVTPTSLARFEREAGARAFELPYVVKSEAIRLLALSGLVIATQPERAREYYDKQERALTVLGLQAQAA